MNSNCVVNPGQLAGSPVWRIDRIIQNLWSRLSAPPISRNRYGERTERQASLAGAFVQMLPHAQTVLSAPRKVQICGLTKSEAEELLDWLEDARGPFIFADCILDARGFNVSFLTKHWHPGMPGEIAQIHDEAAQKESGLVRVPRTAFRIKAGGQVGSSRDVSTQPEMAGALSD